MSNVRIVQCRLCGRPFQSFGSPICANCVQQLDDDIVKVREYLYSHKGPVDANEISKNTDIPEKNILYLMREGRIEAKRVNAVLKCINCGAQISEGRLCAKCSSAATRMASSATSSASSQSRSGADLGRTGSQAQEKTIRAPGSKMYTANRKDE